VLTLSTKIKAAVLKRVTDFSSAQHRNSMTMKDPAWAVVRRALEVAALTIVLVPRPSDLDDSFLARTLRRRSRRQHGWLALASG
jgi:ActR/RegA family two-component response regulator